MGKIAEYTMPYHYCVLCSGDNLLINLFLIAKGQQACAMKWNL